MFIYASVMYVNPIRPNSHKVAKKRIYLCLTGTVKDVDDSIIVSTANIGISLVVGLYNYGISPEGKTLQQWRR